MSEVIDRYIVERMVQLESTIDRYEDMDEIKDRAISELREDLGKILDMFVVTKEKSGERINLDVWEAYEKKKYTEVKALLQKYGRWEAKECEAEQGTAD